MSEGFNVTLDGPVDRFASKSFLKVSFDEPVSNAARKMQMLGSTEAVVVRAGVPIGILTERDVLYQVVAAGLDSATKVVEVMSSPLETVEYGSKARDAIIKMIELGTRRLGVLKNGKLVGLLVQKSIVSDLLSEQVALAELAAPGQPRCPYCGEKCKDGKALSKHIAQVHVGFTGKDQMSSGPETP